MTTHTTIIQRANGDEDDIEVEVEFTLSGGHSGSPPSFYDPGEPAEGPEMEVIAARFIATDTATELTEAEEERARTYVYDNLDQFEDSVSWDDY